MRISEMHFFSLALVAANKALSTDIIEATPIEVNQFTNGEISDSATPIEASAEDASGAKYNIKVMSTNTIKAKWLPIGCSNRITSPDVRRGELVMIYRFADTDQFWWTTWKHDGIKLRKLETVIYAISATTDETAPSDADHTYFLEVSSHNKSIHLHTSAVNGEPYKYDIQLNTAAGFLQIQDDQGNFFKFDTAAHTLSMTNQDGSFMEVNNKNINISCSDKISMRCSDLDIVAGNSITGKTSTTTLTSPDTIINGHVYIHGAFDAD